MASQDRKATILLADDEDDIRISLGLGLEMNGYEVVFARNGMEVLQLFSAAQTGPERIDLVLTDLQMPGITGAKLIDKLMAFEDTVPILVISGSRDQATVKKIAAQRCCGYYDKPFSITELIEWIETALNTK